MRYGWICVLFLFLSLGSRAQVSYGNEWISPSAHYLRLGVTQAGWFRLSATELQKQGVVLETVLPKSLQLYRRGLPVAIRVEGETDGRLDVTDYLEFFGQRNDGLLDTLLYVSPMAMPHPYYSLYSDTASYFLSWRSLDEAATAPAGKRIELNAASPIPANASYHDQKVLQLFTTEYPAGNIYPFGAGYDDGYIETPYDYGEGWTGPSRKTGQWETFRLQTMAPLREVFGRASVEILFVGRNAGEHQVEIWVGDPTKQIRKLGMVQWTNYNTKFFRTTLVADDLTETGLLSLMYRPTREGESVSASYIQWTYPQQIRIADTEGQKNLYPVGKESLSVESKDSLSFYDISDPFQPRQLLAEKTGTTQRISPANSRSILVVKNPLAIPSIHPVQFKNLDPQKIDYLIITHPLVRKPVTGSIDPVADYAAYRTSEAGGRYNPLLLNADEVADRFNYGEPGPNGTRSLMRWLHDKGKLQYVFLIGKSRSPQIVRQQANARSEDMIPSAGWPDSDIALGMGLDPDYPNVPLVPIGRLNAYTSQNVWDYLQKVKQHEAAPAAAPWRKNVLHLSGGRSAEELITFRSFVDGYAGTVLHSGLAPRLQTLSKQTDEPVERFPIAPIVNEGTALITLFGHSNLNVTDIDIGFASNTTLGYRNKGRYPAVLVNGCALGNFYYGPTPISTDWILAPERGAVLFLAHTHNGISYALSAYSQWFYSALSDPNFTSRGFGDIMREGIKRYMTDNNFQTSRITAQQMNLQGDPSIKIFPATRPDYAWQSSSLRIANSRGSQLTAWDDSVSVYVEIANYGRYKHEDYTVGIRRMRDSLLLDDYSLTRTAVHLADTLRLVIPNTNRQGGNETWELVVDPLNRIAEEDKTNNLLATSIQIEEGGAIALLPSDKAVLKNPEVELVAQIPASRTSSRVLFEWDKTPLFGPTTQRDTVAAKGVLAKRTLVFQNLPLQLIYWRVRIIGDSLSSSRSFSYNPNTLATQLPEGVATLVAPYTRQTQEGAPLSARISFENLTDNSFQDSIQVSVKEVWRNTILEKRFSIPPLTARSTYFFNYNGNSLNRSGAGRVLVYFNAGQLPEQLYANNLVELDYEVIPDTTPPVLDVLVDGRRLGNLESVTPQPVLTIGIYDSNKYLLRSDTTGLRISLQKMCNQCLAIPVSLAPARWSSVPSTDFRIDLNLPLLLPGTYMLTVKVRDVKGNEAAPYQIRFRVTEKNQVLDAMASPNPADLWIKFSLELEGVAPPRVWRIKLFDTSGNLISTMETKPTLGKNEFFWIPSDIHLGVFLYSMELEGTDWKTGIFNHGKILFLH